MRAAALPVILAASLVCGLAPARVAGTAPTRAAEQVPARNLLILTFDTTRADHLSVYGGGARVPHLERLAAEGVRFDRAFATTPITLPSHASLMTGLYPTAHGVRNNGTQRLAGTALTLAEILSAGGFETAAVVASRVLDSRYGLDQGFNRYDDRLPPEETMESLFLERQASEVADRGLEWLDERGEARWFLWLHFYDPHWEYAAPEPFRTRYAKEPYDGEIAYADAEAGRVLERLRERGWLDRTLVVATSDHGESLDEHGESSHGLFVYDATMHIPLILRYPPRLGRGVTKPGVVSLVDVLPTALDVLAVPFDSSSVHGRSLTGGAAGKRDRGRLVWLESWTPRLSYGWSELSAVRGENWKYVRAPRPELYAIAKDPGELRDLHEEDSARAARYRERLQELERSITPASILSTPVPQDDEARRALESLGYVSGGAGSATGPRPDPKDKIAAFEAVHQGLRLISAGRDAEAIAAFGSLVSENPDSAYLRRVLGNALQRTGRTPEAIHELERALRIDPEDPFSHADLGFAYFQAGDRAAAAASFRHVLRLNPHMAMVLHNLGLIAAAEGRESEAVDYYERALAEDPHLLRSLINLGTLYEKAGRAGEAVELYLRLIDLDPTNERAFYSAGFLLFHAGRHEEALQVLDRAALAHPGAVLPRLYKARVYRDVGDREGAEREWRAALDLDPRSAEALAGLAALERDGGEEENP